MEERFKKTKTYQRHSTLYETQIVNATAAGEKPIQRQTGRWRCKRPLHSALQTAGAA